MRATTMKSAWMAALLAFASAATRASAGDVGPFVDERWGQLVFRVPLPLPQARGHYQPRVSFVLRVGPSTPEASYGQFLASPKIVKNASGEYFYWDVDNQDTRLAPASRDGAGHWAMLPEERYLDFVPAADSTGAFVAWDAWDSKGTHYRFEQDGTSDEYHLVKVTDASGNRTEYVYGHAAANGLNLLTSVHYNFYDLANPNSTSAVPPTATTYASSVDLAYDVYDRVNAVSVNSEVESQAGLTTVRAFEAWHSGTTDADSVIQSFTEVTQGGNRRLVTTFAHGSATCPSCATAIVTPHGARFDVAYDTANKVRSLTLGGPGLAPLTTSYWYYSGFSSVREDSVTKIVKRTWWEPSLPYAAARVDTGVETVAGTSTPPQYSVFRQEIVERTWKNISSGACVAPVAQNGVLLAADPGTTEPKFWFASKTRDVTWVDGSALAREMTVGCTGADTYGNILNISVDPDVGRAGDEYQMASTFAPPTAQHSCTDCMLTRDEGGLFTRWVYDAAGHVQEEWKPQTSIYNNGPERLAVSWLHNGNGTLSQVGEGATITTYAYDAPYQLRATKMSVAEGTKTLVAEYAYDGYGNVSLITGPYLSASTNRPQMGFLHDDLGRVTAVARSAFVNGSASDAIAAYEYADSASGPSQVTMYSFAVPSSYAGTPPATPDVIQRSVYYDALGRSIQTRERLGGIGGANAAANVLDNLSYTTYRVSNVVIYDGAGRVAATLEPFYSTNGGYVDYRSTAVDSAYPGSPSAPSTATHATLVTYDAQGRTTCSVYVPVMSYSFIPSPGACVSSFTEGASYKRAALVAYRAWNGLLGVKVVPPENNLPGTPEGRVQAGPESFYDASGRMTGTVDVDQNATGYTFYPGGLLSSVTRSPSASVSGRMPSVVTSFVYDDAGRLVERQDPNSGTRTFVYDAQGRIEKVQLPQHDVGGATVRDELRYTYDMGRVSEIKSCVATSVSSWNCTVDWTLAYDNASGATFENVAGRLASAQKAGVATIQFGYSPEGALARRSYTFAGITGTFDVSDTRLLDGRATGTTVTSPAGTFSLDNWFDSFGRLAKIASTAGGGTTYWRPEISIGMADTGAYDALGRLAAVDLDNPGGVGSYVKTTWAYKPYSGLEDAVRVTLGLSNPSDVYWASGKTYRGPKLTGYRDEVGKTDYSYWYTDSGQLRGSKATPIPLTTAALSQSSSMCASYTLTQSFSAGPSFGNLERVRESVPPAFTDSYTYGGQGLQTTVPPGPDGPTALTTNSWMNPLLYDYAGRISSKALGAESFGYDLFNRLVSVSRGGTQAEALAYDPFSALLARVSGNKVTYYLGDRATVTAAALAGCTGPGCAVDQGSVSVDVHLSVGATRVASVRVQGGATGRVLYYHRDHQGSVAATTLGGGVAGAGYRYGPWGDLRAAQGDMGDAASERGFADSVRLSGTLLVMGVRVYDTQLRQFLQPDPIDPTTYTYVGGDPVNWVDPSGMTTDAPVHRCVADCSGGPYEGGTEVIEVTGERVQRWWEREFWREYQLRDLSGNGGRGGEAGGGGRGGRARNSAASAQRRTPGYWDVNANIGVGVGATFGVIIDVDGNVYLYFGGGALTPGVAVTTSPDTVTSGWNAGLQGALGAILGIAGQVGYSFGPDGGWFGEVGMGTAPGIAATVYWVSEPLINIHH